MANKWVSCNHCRTHKDEGKGERGHYIHCRATGCEGMVGNDQLTNTSQWGSITQRGWEHFPTTASFLVSKSRPLVHPTGSQYPNNSSVADDRTQPVSIRQSPDTSLRPGSASVVPAHPKTRTKPLKWRTLNELSLLMTTNNLPTWNRKTGREGEKRPWSKAGLPVISAIQEMELVRYSSESNSSNTFA